MGGRVHFTRDEEMRMEAKGDRGRVGDGRSLRHKPWGENYIYRVFIIRVEV